MKVAALDLGTNSFLCLIAEVEGGQITKIYSDEVQIVRLGQDVNRTRQFHPEALVRARQCLSKFGAAIAQHKPEKILAMATSAARDVRNSEELFSIGRELGIPIEIIPGEREADITFRGAVSGLPNNGQRRAVVDIGGGSTEIIAGDSKGVIYGESLDVGAVRLTEMFFPNQPPSLANMKQFQEYLNARLRPLAAKIRNLNVHEVLAVAGTPTELASSTLGGFDPVRIDRYLLSKIELQDWVARFMKTGPEERIENFQISRGRADVILAGTLILEAVREELGVPHLQVSTRGVRFGVALELANSN
jgi:exopolyphosphatase/guanosine-5'-triphosphate,3'-diphosphate pyrophosphatase